MRSTPRAVADRSINLTIFTALTLEAPRAKSELEHRFLDPIAQRLFAGYPALDYAAAIHKDQVPPNIMINEFFSKRASGSARPTPSSITSARTTPMRCATCSTAASTWWRSWWRIAPTKRRVRIA